MREQRQRESCNASAAYPRNLGNDKGPYCGSNRDGSCQAGERFLQFGRTDAARTQAAPASGGRLSCAATEAVAARQQDSIRLGRAVAAQEPGSNRPHHSPVLHHACADGDAS